MLYIVIPVHNRVKFTRACLQSLTQQTDRNFRVIVINDGCTDETEAVIKQEFPETILINGDGNLWWTQATNLGVMYALKHNATYIMTLNDDTLAPPDFIEKMLAAAREKPDSLFGAIALDAQTHKVVYAGERIDWRTATFFSLKAPADPFECHGLHEVTHFPGRGLLIPAQAFKAIGLFDEFHFPHYAADYDFTHRAARAGFGIYCNYDAKLFTYPHASGGVQIKKLRSLKNYYKHLFGIKGAANLKVFTHYALGNCPKKYLPFFLAQGYVRRVVGYWL